MIYLKTNRVKKMCEHGMIQIINKNLLYVNHPQIFMTNFIEININVNDKLKLTLI